MNPFPHRKKAAATKRGERELRAPARTAALTPERTPKIYRLSRGSPLPKHLSAAAPVPLSVPASLLPPRRAARGALVPRQAAAAALSGAGGGGWRGTAGGRPLQMGSRCCALAAAEGLRSELLIARRPLSLLPPLPSSPLSLPPLPCPPQPELPGDASPRCFPFPERYSLVIYKGEKRDGGLL